jgi:hypothetical protein
MFKNSNERPLSEIFSELRRPPLSGIYENIFVSKLQSADDWLRELNEVEESLLEIKGKIDRILENEFVVYEE